MSEIHKNFPHSKKQQEDKVLNAIDQSQLRSTTNDFPIRELSEDLEPNTFTEKSPDTSYEAETKGSTEIEHGSEVQRFAKSHEPIDETEIKKGHGFERR
jgi:hypothetical protein